MKSNYGDAQPALTADEWRVYPKIYFKPPARYDEGVGIEIHESRKKGEEPSLCVFNGSWSVDLSAELVHATAAVALYKRSFGFSWADVDALREPTTEEAISSIADRIAALLPPRSQSEE